MKRKKHKWLKRIVITFLVLIILTVGAGLSYATNYLFNFALNCETGWPSTIGKPSDDAAKEAISRSRAFFTENNAQTLSIKSFDGLTLTGYYIPAKEKSSKLVVLVHGYGGNAQGMSSYAKYYLSKGFNIFAPDNRAFGNSDGTYTGMGWLDRKDIVKWIDTLTKKLGPDTQILLHGVSLGGAAVMMTSGENLPSNVKCIIEDCGYSSVHDEFDYQIGQLFHVPSFPLLNLASFETSMRLGYSFEDASSVEAVKKSKTPIFFIHGSADTFVPTKFVYKVYDAAKCPKEIWIVPGAKHAQSFNVDTQGYEERIEAFYGKYMK
ncbi:MAG TPA: alpha/beta hydrolase [Ruminiclostridium sp.]|nr:alpha/beta hydrolase [Ruminiclostridium sp.]